MKRLSILVGLIVMACTCAMAQAPSLFFEKITMQDGLSNDHVNCILQDKRGFIWIGTNDGLNRFDGQHFLIFRNRPGDTTSISGNTITDILEDNNGIIWIATSDGGLARYDYKASPSQQFRQFKHQPNQKGSIPVNIINSMIEDRLGFLWLATNGASVIRFNKNTGQFDIPVPTGPRVAIKLCLDSKGMIWAGRQGGGILKIDPVTLRTEHDDRYDNLYGRLPHVVVSSLYSDKMQNMWYGSWDKVLYHYDHVSGVEQVFQQSDPGFHFINDEAVSFGEDNQGRLWIGCRSVGLQVMNKATGAFFNYQNNAIQQGSIADNTINCIEVARDGKIWLGTPRGLSIWDPSQERFTQTFLLPPNNHASLTVYDFYRDANKDLWIGTSEGIFIRRNNSSQIIHQPLSYQGNKLAVTKFFEASDGRFYIGTNYSLFEYNMAHGTIELLPNTEKDKVMNKIIESRIVSIAEDNIDGHPVLLVSPYGHYLAYYDFIDQRWTSRLDSSKNIIQRFNIKDNLIHKIYSSPNGKLWLAATNEGLGEWITNANGSNFFTNDPLKNEGLSNNHVYDIAGDESGNLWISTYGGGLNRFDIRTRKISHIAATNNLLEGIAIDRRMNVWMISNGNLQKYDVRSHSSRTYTLPDLEKSGGVKGYIYKSTDGRMYLGGDNYFIEFHPDSIEDAREKPEVFLTDFKIFNTSYSQLLSDSTIELSYKQNYFTIEFSAPDYSFPQTLKYQYRLDGIDKDWIETDSRNDVVFSNLPGATYTFRVRASNNPGTWSNERAIKIIITPPFWKRWWFFALCILFITSAIYMFYRYRINELLKRQAIRNKIAQDLHDNVGSTLSSISVYSQVAQIQNDGGNKSELNDILGRIGTTSTDMISEMNDIVWAINPRNDSMEKIVQRMESFAKPLLAAKGIRFSFQYDKLILSTWLDMEKRKNFYLIFKEAINNIIKYSNATEVTVDIALRSRRLELTVKDNGIGFDMSKEKGDHRQLPSGNGLKNMKMRAEEMKGEVKIQSIPGSGTTIQLTCHIP